MAFFDRLTSISDDKALREAYSCFSEGSYMISFASFSEIEGAEAEYCLAFHYMNGLGIVKDAKKAFALYVKSMEDGYVPAISEVAQCYGYGLGVKCDDEKAFELFGKAADEGDPFGMSMLSMMYFNGEGTRRDKKKAEEWSDRCEEAGDIDEVEDPGLDYLECGNSILGRMLLMRSAVMGSPVSAKALECMFSFGAGVHTDDDEAGDWKDTAEDMGWDEVTLEDLKGHEKWFSRFIDIDELESEGE